MIEFAVENQLKLQQRNQRLAILEAKKEKEAQEQRETKKSETTEASNDDPNPGTFFSLFLPCDTRIIFLMTSQSSRVELQELFEIVFSDHSTPLNISPPFFSFKID